MGVATRHTVQVGVVSCMAMRHAAQVGVDKWVWPLGMGGAWVEVTVLWLLWLLWGRCPAPGGI